MKIYFCIVTLLLSTQITNVLYSQGSGWEIVYVTQQGNESIYEVQFVNSNTGYCGGDFGKLYKTTNSGLNWIVFDYNTYLTLNSIYFIDAMTGFFGGDAGVIFKTTNGGITVDTMRAPGYDALHSIFFPSRDTGYIAAKYGGFYKTTNGGNNWTKILSPFINFNFEGLYCVNNNIVFASGTAPNWNKIIRTTNGGITLDSLKIDSVNTVYSIFFTDASTGFIVSSRHNSQPPSGVIYKTTNAGSNWTLKFEDSDSIYSSTFYCVRFLNRNIGFVVGGYSFCKTTDGGETWVSYKGYQIGNLYSVYFIDAKTGVACGNGRIIRTTTGGEPIGIKPISNEVPSIYNLFQNYPNPFNPSTIIKFEIPKSSYTIFKIYDVLGREVTTLVNEELKPGTYEVDWNASNYSSGVYFYKLQAGDFISTKRMVLIK